MFTFRSFSGDMSDASINLLLNVPNITHDWWNNPIEGYHGYFNSPVGNNYLHSFGPNPLYGKAVGIDNNIEGSNIAEGSAPYPQNGEWLTSEIKLLQDTIITESKGELGYTRAETTLHNIAQYTSLTPAFGDQTTTRVEVDKIIVRKYTSPEPKVMIK